jgi:hypothetical protein
MCNPVQFCLPFAGMMARREDRLVRAIRREDENFFFAVTPMKSTGAIQTAASIPSIWRFRMLLHGVRLSRLAPDEELRSGCSEQHVTYRVTMADGDLVGVESVPLVVRVNIRAASFVLRVFHQRSAEIRADSSGALFAIHVARDESDVRAPRTVSESVAGVRDPQKVVAP